MKKVLSDLISGFIFTKDIEKDFYKFLVHHNLNEVAHHSYMVANKAKELARLYGLDEEAALIAGYLHDIGNIPREENRLSIARELGIRIIPEEEVYTGILHQRLSRIMAEEIFGVKDEGILNAIECHTTLRSKAHGLDCALFIADKLQWDGEHNKAFRNDIINGLEISLEHGAFAYLKYNYNNRDKMKVVHPWFLEAYNDLSSRCAN